VRPLHRVDGRAGGDLPLAPDGAKVGFGSRLCKKRGPTQIGLVSSFRPVVRMGRFVQSEERAQDSFLLCRLEDYVTEDNPVRVIDIFVEELDLTRLGFAGMQPEATGRPAYHPSTMLKIYLYGYLNRIQSSRRLERETQRNVELMWLTGRLAPDFKTIANFRKDNGEAIGAVCSQFVTLCRGLNLFTRAVVAIDGSKFKAVNNRDKNYTVAKVGKRIEQVDASIARYLATLDRADREESDVTDAKASHIKEKIAGLRQQMQALKEMERQVNAAPDQQVSLTDPDARSMATSGKGTGIVGYNVQTAVDTEHHLIVAHEVTNLVHDRTQLVPWGSAPNSPWAARRSPSLPTEATLTAIRCWHVRTPACCRASPRP
jgi:transposase